MAMNDDDLLAGAARALREQPESGWYAIVDEVLARIRETPRAGPPIIVDDPQPGAAAGALAVSSLVVSVRILHTLAGDPDFTVLDVDVEAEAGAIGGVSLELAARYGRDLQQAATRAVAGCATVIADIVGDRPGVRIDVVFNDVIR
jgi:hypothetical protein